MINNLIIREYKFKHLAFSVISGVFLALSFQKFNLFFLAWIAFIPLINCIYKNNLGYSALYGFIAGIVFNIISAYWFFLFLLSNTNNFGSSLVVSVLLWIYLSLYFVLWSVFVNKIKRNNYMTVIISSAALFAVFDYIKSYLFSGFQTNILGYSQSSFVQLIQITDIFGIFFISFFIVLINMMLYYYFISKNKKFLIQIFLLFIIIITYGFYRIKQFGTEYGNKISVGIIQTVAYKEKKVYYLNSIVKRIQNNIKNLEKEHLNLTLYPETLILGNIKEDEILKDLMKEIGSISDVSLVGGTIIEKGKEYNSIFLISNYGEIFDIYRKKHLVVFGEYLPFRKGLLGRFLSSLNKLGERTKEIELKVFDLGNYTIGINICSENFYPYLSREFVLKGANILTNHTNNSWFNDSVLTKQHFTMNIFRAIENRKNVLISSNCGISGIIDCKGKSVIKTKESFDGNFTGNAYTNSYITIYDKIGDLFVYLCMIYIALILLIYGIFRKRKIQVNK
ncbi:MAG: apolipoprotein N-acyltransferase [Elusimicrobia bacterium]|nr:apolipoprotein N-acyltransferase [Elusimicrobiota bacterium]